MISLEKAFLYRIGESYWLNCASNNEQIHPFSTNFDSKITENEVQIVSGIKLNNLFKIIDFKENQSYLLYQTEKVIAYKAIRKKYFFSNGDAFLDNFKYEANWEIERYRRQRWHILNDIVYSNKSNLEQVLKALLKHTHSEEYSLWLFNSEAKHFHLYCSSFKCENTAFEKGAAHETLGAFLDSGQPYIFRSIDAEALNADVLEGMQSLNRFKLKTDVPAILTFYSKRQNFRFTDRTQTLIPKIVQAKLFEILTPAYLEKHDKLFELTSSFSPGKLDDFLNTLLCGINSQLGWEASSIFLRENIRENGDSSEFLKLKSFAQGEQVTIPIKEINYSIQETSLTTEVYNSNHTIAIYDVKNHPKNTHRFDEPTSFPAKNWVGVPITRKGFLAQGVLRVKNRIEKNSLIPFSTFDIKLLENLAAITAYFMHIEEDFKIKQTDIKQKLKKTHEENRQLNEFLKSFRHELKSPLTVLTQASKTIERRLRQENLISVQKPIPKKVREALVDLDNVGGRLALVTNYLTFDAHELVRERVKARLFVDVITPVTAFSIDYAARRDRQLDVNKDTLFHNVMCDPHSTSMVFNMVIDNAIKYADAGTKIKVWGGASSKYCSIFVENTGLNIQSDEVENIFLRYFRGIEAREQKIEGSGIGLHLAREIMKMNEGDIVLVSNLSPVVFEIRLPNLNR